MHVGIVGGGILGVTLGYHLSRAGLRATVLEASGTLGGLAGPIEMDGYNIDRFYHAILTTDAELHRLFAELGIADQYRFGEAKTAFYHRGKLYPMTNMVDFLTFPPLRWIDRFRLGLTIVYARMVRDWRTLESIGVEKWLTRLSGKRTFEAIWRPLLRAKFDGSFENVPATYIWGRLNRVSGTRSGARQREMAGHLVGGYITLIEALAGRIREAGGAVHLHSPVQEIVTQDGQLVGLQMAPMGDVHKFDAVVSTLQTPLFLRLAPGLDAEYRSYLSRMEYLGIVCPLLVLDRPLTGYWTVNITDESVPFTGVIETTTYIDPKYAGGHHLVYLPKYTLPNSPWFKMSDDEVRETWLRYLEQMFPDFRRAWIKHMLVHRERLVEPIHTLNSLDQVPPVHTPVKHLYLANTGQIYPELTNGEAVSGYARRAAEIIVHDVQGSRQARPASDGAPATWRGASRPGTPMGAATIVEGSSQS